MIVQQTAIIIAVSGHRHSPAIQQRASRSSTRAHGIHAACVRVFTRGVGDEARLNTQDGKPKTKKDENGDGTGIGHGRTNRGYRTVLASREPRSGLS